MVFQCRNEDSQLIRLNILVNRKTKYFSSVSNISGAASTNYIQIVLQNIRITLGFFILPTESPKRNNIYNPTVGQEENSFLQRQNGAIPSGRRVSKSVESGRGGRDGRRQNRRIFGQSRNSFDARSRSQKAASSETEEAEQQEEALEKAPRQRTFGRRFGDLRRQQIIPLPFGQPSTIT